MTTDDPPWLPPIANLIRVIPVEREVERIGGGRLIIPSVELWSGAVIVLYVLSAVDFTFTNIEARMANPMQNLVSLNDDVGTDYGFGQGGGGGGSADQLMRHYLRFGVEPPETASALTISSTGCVDVVEVALAE